LRDIRTERISLVFHLKFLLDIIEHLFYTYTRNGLHLNNCTLFKPATSFPSPCIRFNRLPETIMEVSFPPPVVVIALKTTTLGHKDVINPIRFNNIHP